MAVSLGEKAEVSGGSVKVVKRGGLWVEAREFKRTFLVVATPDEDEDDIRTAVGIPQIATLYKGAVCRGHDVKESSPVRNPFTGQRGFLYEVDVAFDNDVNPDDAGGAGQGTSPTSRRPKCRWRCETVNEVIPRDVITGDPIVNRAGYPIVATSPIADYIREITRYENYPFDPTVFLAFQNRTNSVEFYGAPEGCAWLFDIESDEEDVDGTLYERVTYRVRFRIRTDPDTGDLQPDTWKASFLNYGPTHRPFSAEDDPIRAVDKVTGEPIEVNLDDDGLILQPGEPVIYIKFNDKLKADLNFLNLGPYA
jgi:hypothetical protein